MDYEQAALDWVEFHARWPQDADKFSCWYPFLCRDVESYLALRPHLTWLPDPTFDCNIEDVISDPLPCHSHHVLCETYRVVSSYLQLTQHPEKCLWHDPTQGRLIVGYTPVGRVDLEWRPPLGGLRLRVDPTSGSLAFWSPGGLWLGFHILVLGWSIVDLTRWMVIHKDGDESNYRRDNLGVVRIRGGDVRQLYCLPTGALRVTILGTSHSAKIGDGGPWETLARILRRPSAPWHDFRGNIVGLVTEG